MPCHLNILVVAAKTDIGSSAIGALERLVLAERHGEGGADARAAPAGVGFLNSIQGARPTEPEIAVKRGPKAGLSKVTAQVTFKAANRPFCLWSGYRREWGVGGEEAGARISTERATIPPSRKHQTPHVSPPAYFPG